MSLNRLAASFVFIAVVGCQPAAAEINFEAARHMMVAHQIEARGIKDPAVLDAMRRVKRHEFVPAALRPMAYQDSPLPIGHSQTVSQPYIVALMTELLGLSGGEKVLEIGTGSGYQAAVLARICRKVYSIEIVEPLVGPARRRLNSLGYGGRVHIKEGDGYLGWPEKAPFDAILVTASPPEIPQALKDQLADGGRMVLPLDVGSSNQVLIRLTRRGDQFDREEILPVLFVPMVYGEDAGE